MSSPPPDPQGPVPPRHFSPVAGFLSYLVPGLGQMVQGRFLKGLLFLVCLWGMFFTGQALGDWKNVYLPDLARGPEDPRPWENNTWRLPRPFLWVSNVYHRWHFAGQFWIGVAAWPALWQYNNLPVPSEEANPFWHDFQKGPRDFRDEAEQNEYLTNRDKTPDLAWVYTVIAGVLNILVIYDAYAGPAYGALTPRPRASLPGQGEPARETSPTEVAVP